MEGFDPLVERIHGVINKYEDPRIRNWPLMSSPFPTIAATIMYLSIIKVFAPIHMKNRKPYNLQKVLVGYNLFQVLFSLWMFYGFCTGGWLTGYNLRCQPVGTSTSPKAYRMLFVSYVYYLSKFTELVDTVLFILRKKDSQVTPLHVFHHGIMPLGSWLCVKYAPDGNMTFIGLLNSFVHIIMYGYYMLSAMGPKVQKYLWWKKYITAMQLIQFVAILVHAVQSLVSGCNFPKPLTLYIIFQTSTFFALFWFFYKKSYTKARPAPTKVKPITIDKLNGLTNGLTNGVTNGVVTNGATNGVINGVKLLKSQ